MFLPAFRKQGHHDGENQRRGADNAGDESLPSVQPWNERVHKSATLPHPCLRVLPADEFGHSPL